MDFRTKVNIAPSNFRINQQQKVLVLGSCFAENIGELLHKNKFEINLNPFGILYNPTSISQSIEILIENKEFTEKDLFEYRGIYNSFSHHGSFSSINKAECLSKINSSLLQAAQDLLKTDILLITFGTAYVYQLVDNMRIVSNCHKLPGPLFNRYRLNTKVIIEEWNKLILKLTTINPKLQIIFTISPIRHLRDGAHDNQISKSILLLAVEELCKINENTHYFPSYEIVLDELRDYRFYNEDMTHPNKMAIKYIWEQFSLTYFDADTQQIINEWKKICSSLEHRPINEQSAEHEYFMNKTLQDLVCFEQKYPFIHLDKEKNKLTSSIKYKSSL